MNIDEIHGVIGKLAIDRPVFHSEEDFQLSLFRALSAWTDPFHVRLEETAAFPGGARKIDIVIKDLKSRGSHVAIELKYAPKATEIISAESREVFRLKNQPLDLNRHGFWVDVERMEKYVCHNNDVEAFVIFLTNNERYWDEERGNYQNQDKAYRIYEKREGVTGRLVFKPSYPEGDVILRGFYGPLSWNEYSSVGEDRFRYLLLKVRRKDIEIS